MAQVAGGEALAPARSPAPCRGTHAKHTSAFPYLSPISAQVFFPLQLIKKKNGKKKIGPAIPSWLVFTQVNIFYVYTVRMK